MEHPEFAIDDWSNRFVIDDSDEPAPITSPIHLCRNHYLRQCRGVNEKWGEPTPVDIFVWATGPPPKPHLTKTGGTPYRPASADWPCDRQGNPWNFLGQICFSDSSDIVPSLPGDVLLVFLDAHENYRFEWQAIGLDFDGPRYVPEPAFSISPKHGYICRTFSFPAYDEDAGWSNDHENGYRLARYEGTQIGPAPHWPQHKPTLRGQLIATFGSIGPVQDEPWPYANHKSPVQFDPWDPNSESNLSFGDAGCLFISVDDDGKVDAEDQCY